MTTYTTDTDPMAEVRIALGMLTATARLTSGIPVAAINGLRCPDASVFTTTVRGAPVTVSKAAGEMTLEDVACAWGEVWDLQPPAGARIHVNEIGEALLVSPLEIVGGAA